MTAESKSVRVLAISVAAAATILFAGVVAGCGDDDRGLSGSDGNSADAGFAREMIEHHRSAIEMAEIAQRRALHDEIKALAESIIEAQRTEIVVMTRIAEELRAHGQRPSSLGMSHAQKGMDMDMAMLERARPFDRAFLEMMVQHHRGAVEMAEILVKKGTHGELVRLARRVIKDQTAEIKTMQSRLKDWYGIAPSDDDSATMMDHDGM